MAITSDYNSEKARIEGTIIEAINTALPPSEAARKALAGAFPAVSFTDKGDGTLSVQGLDATQRQGLEDGLFEVNLSLAGEAVARGLPLMQYLHPDAAHVGVKTVPRFLQVCLELARPLLSEPIKDAEKAGGRRRLLDYEGWARLFEGLMEVGTIADCADLFRLMEGSSGTGATSGSAGGAGAGADTDLGWCGVFCSDDFRREQGAKLTLLRMSNMLFRRLSKAYDVRLCGRLLIFISRCYELNDKSGLNVAGALNAGLALPVDDVEPGAVDSIGEQIDRRLYAAFWGLQAVFQNPAQALQPAVYGKVLSDVGLVLKEFAAIQNPVAATGPWVASRAGAGTGAGGAPSQQQRRDGQGGGGADAMDVDGGTAAGGGGRGGGGGAGSEADGGGAGARYLTSSKLFGLQLRDCTFRRHFLLQALALLQYVEQPSKADKSGLGSGRPEGLEALREELYKSLASTKDHGPEFAAAVRCVLQHEGHWVAWKHGTAPPATSSAGGGAAGGGAATAGTSAAGGGGAAAAAELCRDFSRPPAPPTREVVSTSQGDAAGSSGPAKRKRGAGGGGRSGSGGLGLGLGPGSGRYAVSRGVAGLPDPLAGLVVGERRTRVRNMMGEEEVVPMLPSPEELLAPIAEDLDPDNDVEAPYRRVREPVFAWKRMRTLARNCLEFYKKGDDLEEAVLEMQPELRQRIAARQAAREAELAAAAAAEAEAAGGDGGREEGEAVPSPGAKG